MGVLKVKDAQGNWVPIGMGFDVSPWTNVTFQNGWSNEGGTLQTVQYRKVGDVVQLRGTMKPGTVGLVAFTLPVGFRPPMQIRAMGFAFTPTTLVRADIHINGDYNPYDGAGQTQFRTVDCQFSTVA